MKHFLIKSIILLSFALVLLMVGELVIHGLPNPYKYKHQWMLDHAGETEVIILGSSHAYYGIDPQILSVKAFNLALPAQNYKYDYFLLQQYSELYTEKLKKVILPVSYFSFFIHDFEESDDWYYAINYKVYMDCPYHSSLSKYNFELSHLYVYSQKLKSFFTGKEQFMCDSTGRGTEFTLSGRSPLWDTQSAEGAVERHTYKEWNNVQNNILYFRKITEFCRNNSISLVLVTTPTWHAYSDRLDKKQLNKMYEIIVSLQKEYGFSYFNYLTDKRFNADDFYDSDHLSEIGARKFTNILNDEIISRP